MNNPQKNVSAISRVLDSEMKPETARMAAGGVTLAHGQAIVQTGGAYQTAVMVQVKRDIGTPDSPGGSVLSRSTTEAKLLKERFFYGWDVNDRASGGKKSIEGISVDGAYMLLRNWTNSVCDVELVSVDSEAYTFKAIFVDLEGGATCARLYRQHRSAPPGKYDQQRWDDMAFSNGQSRAIRNVICAALPQWLQDRCMEAAQSAGHEESGDSLAKVFARESESLAKKYTTLLRQSWGRAALEEVVSQIKRDEGRIDQMALTDLRATYRGQLDAYEQSMPVLNPNVEPNSTGR